MNAKDLMIGDWVSYDGNPVRVNCVASNSVGLDGVESDIICKEDMIEPVPITPEILEKNGFKKQAFEGWEFDGYRENSGLVYLVLWRNDYSTPHLMIDSFAKEYGTYSSFNISSLHQLQHALKFCGIDKEIEP